MLLIYFASPFLWESVFPIALSCAMYIHWPLLSGNGSLGWVKATFGLSTFKRYAASRTWAENYWCYDMDWLLHVLVGCTKWNDCSNRCVGLQGLQNRCPTSFRRIVLQRQKRHEEIEMKTAIVAGGQIRQVLYLGGGFEYFLFSPLPGEMIQFD